MKGINIISLGSFKIDNRDFFKKLLEALEIENKIIKNVEGGEKFKYVDKKRGIKYRDYHFITDGLAFKNISKNLRILLNDVRDGENHLVIYIVDSLEEKNFSESLAIIEEFSQSNKFSFLLVYLENKENINKEYLKELNKLLKVRCLKVQGNSFKFYIDEKTRIEFFYELREAYYNREKQFIQEKFANNCMKKVYATNLKLSNEKLNTEEILNMKKEFISYLNGLIKESIEKLNNEIEILTKSFELEEVEKIKIMEKRFEEKYDDSVLGIIAREVNKEETVTLREAIWNKIKRKKEKGIKEDYGKIFINEAFSMKKILENIFNEYKLNKIK